MSILEKIKDFYFVHFCLDLDKDINKKIPYSWEQFGRLKRTINNSSEIKLIIVEDIGGNFEIWKTFTSIDKYGDKQADAKQIGFYHDAGQVLHYSDELNEIIDLKYF